VAIAAMAARRRGAMAPRSKQRAVTWDEFPMELEIVPTSAATPHTPSCLFRDTATGTFHAWLKV
jgi:hypothetical protein